MTSKIRLWDDAAPGGFPFFVASMRIIHLKRHRNTRQAKALL
jgi:hypothetical protein